MSTLTEFLLARIAEDEAVARGATPGTLSDSLVAWEAEDRSGVIELLVDPGRVLAECEAKRRIVNAAQGSEPFHNDAADDGWIIAWVSALTFLALPYVDHPDYRDEWKP